MAAKDPITCHVLDTTTGRPAPNLTVELTCASQVNGPKFIHVTDADGRISKWNSPPGGYTVDQFLEGGSGESKVTIWKLKFATGAYYGEGKTFWPEVELTFYVKPGQHHHVPLLLGPYSYTTYRGS